MVPTKAAGRAAKAELLMPEDISLLLQQGDLAANLTISATYQQLAITVAGLAIVFSIGFAIAAPTALQAILGGYIMLWFLIEVPSAVFLLSQRYTIYRYRLIKKLIARQDYSGEKEKVINFLEILIEKGSDKEISYKPIIFYFGALTVIACIVSLVWELIHVNIGMAGYSIGGIIMIAATLFWSGRLEREMKLTKPGASTVSPPTSQPGKENAKVDPENLQFIYEQSMRLFEMEAANWRELDSKALSFAGFFGVIAALSSVLLLSIANIRVVYVQYAAIFFYLLTFVNVFFGFYFAREAVKPRTFRCDPDPEKLRLYYYNKKRADTLDVVTANLVECKKANSQASREKATSLNKVTFHVLVGLVSIFILVMVILYGLYFA